MTVADIIKEMEFELVKIDKAEKQLTNEDFYYTLAYYRDLLSNILEDIDRKLNKLSCCESCNALCDDRVKPKEDTNDD